MSESDLYDYGIFRIRTQIAVARDLGKTIELASGLSAGTRFIENPTDTTRNGTTIQSAAPVTTAK